MGGGWREWRLRKGKGSLLNSGLKDLEEDGTRSDIGVKAENTLIRKVKLVSRDGKIGGKEEKREGGKEIKREGGWEEKREGGWEGKGGEKKGWKGD
ncbi:hypothetical protein Pmani_010273 [Petrolisthes manimaculis]|uniref:Uncharacterized protein n=1 Tax=Petrolisthes manimaculis TaxID=1843537 RepID=A0AAE1Q4U7_9EUCA|nr:hypothetical protein Pmani_010273 [Petrolisthes manimaculis]